MGAFRDLWLRWKMLRLPWRKMFLVGQDLRGNTFWEFRDQINHGRWRRMVKGRGRPTLSSLSEVQISPQWHQWLRYTRHEPPTMQEQAADVQRQAQLKINAKLADERWAAKAKYIEKPGNTLSGKSPNNMQQDAPDDAANSSRSSWSPEAWTPGVSKR